MSITAFLYILTSLQVPLAFRTRHMRNTGYHNDCATPKRVSTLRTPAPSAVKYCLANVHQKRTCVPARFAGPSNPYPSLAKRR